MCVDPVSIGAGLTAIGSAVGSAASAVGGASTIGTALSIGSTAASFIAQSQNAASQNQAAMNNAANANRAAQFKYEDAQRKYIYDSTAVNKEGYDAALRGRAAKATGLTSSADSGFSGISLDNLLAAEDQKAAENQSRIAAKRDDLTQSYGSSVRGFEEEAKGRASSIAMKTSPSPLGLALNIGGDVMKNEKVKAWLS